MADFVVVAECDLCVHAELHGWHGVEGSAHCANCHLTWTSIRAAHCPSCHEHFTSYTASDLHDGPNGCIRPGEVPGLRLAVDGRSWRCAAEFRGPISAPSSAVSPAVAGKAGK